MVRFVILLKSYFSGKSFTSLPSVSDGVGRWPAGVRVLPPLPGFHHRLLILSVTVIVVSVAVIAIRVIIVLIIAFFESLCFL